MVLDWIIANWGWVLFLVLFVVGAVLMRRIPNTQVIAKVIFKVNSQKGIKLMDYLGQKYSRFWKGIGDFALIILFGGLGTAYVTNHQSKRGQQIILSVFTFFTLFAYLGSIIFQLFPFKLAVSNDILILGISLAAAILVYILSSKLSNKFATIAAFILASSFFASMYILSYVYSGDISWLLIGLFVGILGIPALVIVSLSINAFAISTGASTQPGLNIGYPELENGVPVLKYAGTDISIPFFPDILIALIIMLALHEGFHGLLARAQNIPIKNTGLLFASIIPLGAFVEPDEEKFKKEKSLQRLRVYSVGSFANIFVVALLVFLLGNFLVSSDIVERQGVFVYAVIANSSASEFIEPGDVIYSINGTKLRSFFELSTFMEKTTPNQMVSVATDKGDFDVSLGAIEGSQKGFLGVQKEQGPSVMVQDMFSQQTSGSYLPPSIPTTLFHILKWIFFLNLMIGVVNLLPIKPLDGGYVYDGFFFWLEKHFPATKKIHLAKLFSQGFMVLMLVIFIINALPYGF